MKRIAMCLLAGSALLSQGAFAQNAYLGAAIGSTSYSEDGFDETDDGFKLNAGIRINENFAIEGNYIDFGRPEGPFYGIDSSVRVDGFGLSALGIMPISDEFELFGKVGLFGWNADIKVGPFSSTDDGTDVIYGFGAAYRLSDQLSLRAEWEFVDLEGGDLDMLSIGAQLDF